MLQTILIPRDKFSLNNAILWIKKNKHKLLKIDITDNFFRFRQSPPKHGSNYYSKKLSNGIVLVFD